MKSIQLTDQEIIDHLRDSNQLFSRTMSISSRLPNEITVFLAPPDPKSPAQLRLFRDALKALMAIDDKLAVEMTRTNDAEDAIICVTYETAYVLTGQTDYQNYVANVTSEANLGDEIEADGEGGIASKPVYIQLGHTRHGNSACDCYIDVETIIHEFGHAMGLHKHINAIFDGQVAISEAFWDVLATLYANPPGTRFDQLNVQRVA